MGMGEGFLSKARGLLGRSVADAPKPGAEAPARKITTYHAVTIVPGPRCCAHARALQGQRFLSKEAPALPLRGCNSADCTCRYEHYDDRRARPRRAHDMGVAVDGWVEEDRREADKKRGRRNSDR
jgi:hypothetical protein